MYEAITTSHRGTVNNYKHPQERKIVISPTSAIPVRQDIRGPLQTVRLRHVLWVTTEPWSCTKPCQSRMEKAVECMYVYFGVLLLMP
jgi:hypothetical protein